MEIVTYSLNRSELSDSTEYYQRATALADEVLKESDVLIKPIVEAYYSYLNNIETQQCNAPEETLLELLILGVLMRIYYPKALKLSNVQYKLLTVVNNTRKSNRILKPTMNVLKGIMANSFLISDTRHKEGFMISNINQLKKLILWLDASGEFNREVNRLEKWEVYLKTLSNEESKSILKIVNNFAVWFGERSNEALGKYTFNVERYLESIKDREFWKEDIVLRKRVRVEYHLNMVGAELMNRAFRQAFVATNKKVLLLPVCMVSPRESSCKSEGFGRDFKCKGCSSKCQVNQLTTLGLNNGFSIMVIPHESSISSYSSKDTLFDKNTGVIGVSCVLNLISGGWLLKDMNIPAQCVLLEYCGCKNHWSDEGISTQISIEKLKEILT